MKDGEPQAHAAELRLKGCENGFFESQAQQHGGQGKSAEELARADPVHGRNLWDD
jgi:hypothetical protein